MLNSSFFNSIQLLRDKYYTDFQFNLFSVLRGGTDEVRLHSRFISEILDLSGSHGFDEQFLQIFLKLLGIDPNLFDKPTVFTEYKNIDILVKSGSSAIIIENKIEAKDQDNQLNRYYNSIRDEGFKDIYLVYLTLNGEEPSSQSIEGLDKLYLNSNRFMCVSYKNDIYGWVESCLALSVRIPALRESFVQYLELIEILTEKVKSVQYMKNLKDILIKDDNFQNFLDLQEAFNSVLLDLQVDLWERIQTSLEPILGKPGIESIISNEGKITAIRNFIDKKRDSKYFGLYYPLENGACFGVEMQGDGIIAGVYCQEEEQPKKHRELLGLLENINHSSSSKWWPCYRYIEPNINYRSITRRDLTALASDNTRQEIADSITIYISSVLELTGGSGLRK